MESHLYSEIIGVIVCLLFSSFFSGTETALTALKEAKAYELMEKYSFIAPLLKQWLERPSLLLSTILIGNNIVNILGAVLAGKIAHIVLDQHIGTTLADASAVAVMTIFVLILGEITPKTFAKINPHKFAVPALFLLRPINLLFFFFSHTLSAFARVMVKMLGGNDALVAAGITQTDIEYMIKKGSNLGVFEEEEQGELLSSVIEFKDTLVKEIMIPRTDAHFLEIDTTIEEAIDKLSEWRNSRIPVYDDSIDNMKGILLSKNLVSRFSKGDINPDQTIGSVLRKPVLFVPESQRISETLKVMQNRRTHLAVVVDEFGGTSGIITLEDILEELVGDIKDEDDIEANTIIKLKNNVISVDAHISISDLEEELNIEIPDDGEYNSLGGFIIAEHGSVPRKGFKMQYDNYQFRVADSNERHIVRVEIKKLKESA